MKQNFTIALTTLGVIFIGLLLIGVGFFMANSGSGENVQFKTPFSGMQSKSTQETPVVTESVAFDLSEAQKQALVALGVDPATIPTTISPSQQTCFIDNLGEEKFVAVRNGAVPSSVDFLKVRNCL